MDTEILSDLGLTNAEIKIYIALLELGVSTAGPIIKKTGLQNSVVHLTLPKLSEKGFISHRKKGGIREYLATDPENVLKFIDEKKKRFQNIMPQLKSMQTPIQSQEVEVYDGFKGFKAMHHDLIKDSKKGDEYLFFAFYVEDKNAFQEVYDFYQKEFYQERKEKGIVIKGLLPKQMVWRLTEGWYKKHAKIVNFPIPTNISIFKDKITFTPMEDGKFSFLIHSKQLAESFRQYFYSVWNNKNL